MTPLSLSDLSQRVLPDREWRTLPSGVLVLQDAEGPILQLSHHPDPLKFPNHAILRVDIGKVPTGMLSWRVILFRQRHTSFDAQANVLRKRLNHYIAKHPAPFSYTVRRRVALAQRALAVLEPNAVLDKSPSKSPSKSFARLAQAEPLDASDGSFFVHPPVACACFAVHVQTGALLSQIGVLDSVEKGAQIGAWLVYRVERVTWAADGSWRLPDGTSIQARETEMPPAPAPAPAPASPPSAESSLLDLAAMAKRIGVTKQTLWRWVRDGRDDIPVYGAGRTMRFDPEEMLAWFRSARTREKDS